jgi:cytochrome c-type biogenesis protein CcmE
MRLIGVTAIILIAVAAVLLSTGKTSGAYYKTVKEVSTDKELVGQRVRVGGAVIPGSWDRKTNPMTFKIRAEEDKDGTGPALKVVYTQAVPSTFGDGVVAIVTGELQPDGTIESDEMITKCPSKYENAQNATKVDALTKQGPAAVGRTQRVTGYIVPGSIQTPGNAERFKISSEPGGAGVAVGVAFDGGLSAEVTDDTLVILTGSLEQDGLFAATQVAMDKAAQTK